MLTDAGIKALKPKDRLYKVVDRDGMHIVVLPSGSVVFRYDDRMNGWRETLTLGRYGPADLSSASIAVNSLSITSSDGLIFNTSSSERFRSQ